MGVLTLCCPARCSVATALLFRAVLVSALPAAFVSTYALATQSAPVSSSVLTGTTFVEGPVDLLDAPRIRELRVPRILDGNAIWGATGRDSRGHVWFGVSAWSPGMSAHLFEYEPVNDRWHDRGSVLDQLDRAGRRRDGEGQIKIHSKIVTGQDGWLYFASSDEEGEREDGSAPPRWGGHLWRIHPRTYVWQHLAATPEGLVAVNGYGRYVYALGYWNHVLYQYDTARNALRTVTVGSIGGHVSRNFIVDGRGHAFVPRTARSAGGSPVAELVEYDTQLRELGASPMAHYFGKEAPAANHGITGLTWLADGRLLFTTHIGQLYAIDPGNEQAAMVSALGWFHPEGARYAPSLFPLAANARVGGVTQAGTRFEWVVRDLLSGTVSARTLDLGGLKNVLLYGSMTRDDAGRAYLVGWTSDGAGGQRPLVLQVGASP